MFGLCHQRVAGNLVVTHVGTQLHETWLQIRQTEEVIVAFDFHIDLLACIHRELVDDGLSEETMIHIGMAEGLQRRFPITLTEIAVDELKAWTEKTRRYDKDIGEDVDNPNVHLP